MAYDDYEDVPDRQPVVIDVLRKNPALGVPSGSAIPRPKRPADYYQQALDLARQAGEVGAGAVDTSQIERLARARAEGAGADIGAGIVLSKLGGRGLAPLGGSVLREALAARGPQRIGGVDVVGGEAVRDPFRERDAQVQKLMAQSNLLERMGQHQDASEARAEARAIQQQQFQEQRADRALARAVAAGNREDAQETRRAEKANAMAHQLRSELAPLVKDARLTIAAAANVENALTNPRPTAASDMRAVFTYMKLLDPTSVVREGEYATAKNAASWPEAVRNSYNKAIDGQFLSPKQRADFITEARRARGAADANFMREAERFAELARRQGIDPTLLAPELGMQREAEIPEGAVRARGAPAQPRTRRATDEAGDEPPEGAVRPRSR
jgi:hypothetical protein